MSRRTRSAVLAAVLPAVLLAAGCGGDGSDGSDGSSGGGGGGGGGAAEDGCTSSPASTEGFTDAGQTLCPGTQAVVSSLTELGTGRLGLTVTDVEQADEAVLTAAFEAVGASGFDETEWQVVYARITVELLEEETPGAVTDADDLDGDGSGIGQLFGQSWMLDTGGDRGPGPLPDCEQPTFESGAEVGDTVEGCAWFLAKLEPAPAEVRFQNVLGLRGTDAERDDDPTVGEIAWPVPD